jgi:RyR domain
MKESIMDGVETGSMLHRDRIVGLARVAHEANRVYCQMHGDDSQASWETAPRWQKESAYEGIEGVLRGNTPEQSHESWLAHKAKEGWKYGPVKDPEKKEHPCFVPYAELPPVQQKKDAIFTGVVRAMAVALGMPVATPTQAPTIELHPDHILQFFAYDHLKEPLRSAVKVFCDMAHEIVRTTPRNPERTVALRKLLESKDAAVRAVFAK